MNKSPIYKNGMLICPYCFAPLLAIEETHFKLKCAICGKQLGKLNVSVIKKIAENFPKELAKEWLIEIKTRQKGEK